jgi:hypothetical protein
MVIPTFCATVTDALADLLGSATDVAVTVMNGGLGAVEGAVYRPVAEIAPQSDPTQPVPLRLQVTAVLLDPVTLEVNCCWPPTPIDTSVGEIPTEILLDTIVAVVDPVIAAFETEVAVTVTLLGLGIVDGAV